ncbi:MAG: TonB-dependent receptor [Pyrinomonadaceae bacterium]|nr:TonB-dependent receptor [Pyrinomonadaceae bacterium]
MNRFIFGLCLLFCVCSGALSQNLSGTVKDSSGAVIVNAEVSATRVKTSEKTIARTDRFGAFRIEGLGTGIIIIRVRADGFKTHYSSVNLNEGGSADFMLEPRSVAETVSVTSTFLAGSNENLERTAGAIQTIGRTELETARVFNFSEALRRIAGVSVRNEEGFGLRPNISIRGSSPTRSRKVLILEDGIPLSYAPYGDNSSYYHPPIERFNSIEVLKGSGQIEYGPVTVAGVVNYLTPNPPERRTITIKTIGGNRDYFNGSVGYSDNIESTGIVLNYTRKQGEGSRENLRSGVNDLSAKVIQTINSNNILTFKYSHFDESSQLTYSGLTEAEFAADPRQNPFLNDDLEFFREGLSVAHTAVLTATTSLTTNFYTSYFSRDWWRQSSNSEQRPSRINSDPDCRGMADLSTTCGNQGTPRDFRTIGFEPRLNAQFDLGGFNSQLNTGFRLHYETQNRRKWNGFTPGAREDGSQITERNLRNTLAFSTFIQNRFIWKKFSFTPGLRIENVRYKRSNLLNGATGKTDLTQLIPGFGVAYNPFSNTTVFAGIHRGFAPPSTSDILTNSGGVVDLDAELSWNIEIGIRTRPAEAVSVDATFFRNDYSNQIVSASVAGGVGSTRTNGGETLQQGFEINSRIDSNRIFRSDYNIYFQSAYTFLAAARFESTRFSSVPGYESVPISGNRLPYAPKHLLTSSVGTVYRGFNAFIENVFIGGQFSDDLNTIKPTANGQRGLIGSQMYFNATANYRVERMNSTFFVTSKNIFDRLFVVDRTRGIYPSSPRLIQFGWKWNFAK